MCAYHCTFVIHSAAQNSSDNLLSCPVVIV